MTLLALLAAAAATSLLPVPVRVAPAASQTALSVFRESAPDRCTWLRVDPVQGRRERIAEFPRACDGLSASWNPAATHAIVEFPGEWKFGTGRTRHAWLIDVTARPATLTELPLPQAGILDVLAFDTAGFPTALFLDFPSDTVPRSSRPLALDFEGVSHDVPAGAPGSPVLAHAFRFERGSWTHIETVATTSEACGSIGVRQLAASDRLARTSARLLDPTYGHDLSRDPIDPALFDVLESHERIDAESTYGWVRLDTERSIVIAAEGGYEYAFLTTPILLVDDDGVQELGGMAENAVLAAESRGRYLLLSEAVSGARPLLYDLDGGRLLFSDGGAVAVTFWP